MQTVLKLLLAGLAALAAATDTTPMELSCEKRVQNIPRVIDEATFQRAVRAPRPRRNAPRPRPHHHPHPRVAPPAHRRVDFRTRSPSARAKFRPSQRHEAKARVERPPPTCLLLDVPLRSLHTSEPTMSTYTATTMHSLLPSLSGSSDRLATARTRAGDTPPLHCLPNSHWKRGGRPICLPGMLGRGPRTGAASGEPWPRARAQRQGPAVSRYSARAANSLDDDGTNPSTCVLAPSGPAASTDIGIGRRPRRPGGGGSGRRRRLLSGGYLLVGILWPRKPWCSSPSWTRRSGRSGGRRSGRLMGRDAIGLNMMAEVQDPQTPQAYVKPGDVKFSKVDRETMLWDVLTGSSMSTWRRSSCRRSGGAEWRSQMLDTHEFKKFVDPRSGEFYLHEAGRPDYSTWSVPMTISDLLLQPPGRSSRRGCLGRRTSRAAGAGALGRQAHRHRAGQAPRGKARAARAQGDRATSGVATGDVGQRHLLLSRSFPPRFG